MSREMKETNIEWIGAIPKNWNVLHCNAAFVRKNQKAEQEDPVILSLARSGVRVRDISNNEGQIAESYYNYNPVEPGDLLLNTMDLISGANCSISQVAGVISPAYVNLRARDGFDSLYYDYYFKTQYWSMAFFAHGKGVSFDNRWTLSAGDVLRYYIPVPPEEEQRKISRFLKKKCDSIDKVMEETEKSIEEYKLLKQSLITEAVTKGIHNSRPMKNSGIEWIGEIPKDWSLIRIKSIFNNRKEKNNPVKTDFILSLGLNYGVVPYSEKSAAGNKAKEDLSAYLIAHPGDIVMNSMNIVSGSVGISNYLGCVSPVYYMLYPKDEKSINKNYYYGVFQTKVFQRSLLGLGNGILVKESSNGTLNTVRLRIPYEKLGIQLVPQPPKEEQDEISDYINDRTSAIDKLIEEKRKFIDELNEYKKAIIYEYVTGKKEVPEL